MQVNPFKSLGAKLFYLMSGLVLLTVTFNTYFSSKRYMQLVEGNLRDATQSAAESAKGRIESTLAGWTDQMRITVRNFGANGGKNRLEALQNFVDSSKDYVALEVITENNKRLTSDAFAFTEDSDDMPFEDVNPDVVRERLPHQTMTWLKHRLNTRGPAHPLLLGSLAKDLNLALINVAVQFPVEGSKETVWVILTVWQDKLVNGTLPLTGKTQGMLVDVSGRTLASPVRREVIGVRSVNNLGIFREAVRSRLPEGFQANYHDDTGRTWVGAFARLPAFDDTMVIVQRDAASSYDDVKATARRAALLGSLFVLIAVLFSFIGAAGITRGLREVTDATNRIASGDFQSPIRLSSSDEVGLLGSAVNHMSQQIVGLLNSQVEKARFEKELETARVVQTTFFPRSDIVRGDFSATGHYQPASECGGDLWGHFAHPNGSEFIFIADAMGHGTPAALVTALAYSTTMTIADILKSGDPLADSPGTILERLNRIICDAVKGSISMTFFAAMVDLRTGKMTFANAGHNFPFIIPANPKDKRAKPSRSLAKISPLSPISLSLMGVPLGIDPKATYKTDTLELAPGDKIVLFTDGLIECTSPEGKAWGRKTLIEQSLRLAEGSANDLKTGLIERAYAHFDSNPQVDDVTLVVAEIAKNWSVKSQLATSA